MGCPCISIKTAVCASFLSLVRCYHGNLHYTGEPSVHQSLCTVEPTNSE